MSVVREYLFDIWQRNADPRSNDFLLIDGSPMKAYVHIFAVFLVIKLVTALRSTSMNVNPISLIFNGFLFGISMVGFMFWVWFSKFGENYYSCKAIDSETNDVVEYFNVYANYVMYWVKIVETTSIFLPHILLKNSPFPAFGPVLESLFEVGYYYAVLKLHPGGIVLFSQTLDLLVSMAAFGHRTLVSASAEMRPLAKWTDFVVTLRTFQYLITLSHGLYFAIKPECSVSMGILYCQILYSISNLLLITFTSKRSNISKC